jgi:PAS domain S-box-containing protein
MSVLTLRLAAFERALPRGVSPVVLSAVGVAAGYYAGCQIGFALRFPSSGISFLWPPTAVLTAALLLTSQRRWPAMLAGALVAHAIAHAQIGLAAGSWLVQFLGNGVQASLAALIIQRYSSDTRLFTTWRSVATLIAASVLAPVTASLIPAYVYVNMGWAVDFWDAWRTRTVSNVIASLTLVPPFVTAWQHLSPRPSLPPLRRLAEFGLLLLGLLLTDAVALRIDHGSAPGAFLEFYAHVPFLLWAALRFGTAGLSCGLLATALLTIASALRGHGPFGHGPFVGATLADTVVAVQIFIGVTAVPLMLIAGLLHERRAEHRTLVEVEQQNSAILRAIPDLMFLQSRDGVYLKHYARSDGVLLTPPETFLGRNMRDILPPDLAETFARAFTRVSSEEPVVIDYSLILGGETRYYEARCIALDRDRILSIVRETSQRTRSEIALRESQQRYTLATAGGGVGVWDANLITGELFVDPQLKAVLGYAEDEIPNLASAWERLVHPADLDELRLRSAAHVLGESPRLEVEHRVLHRDGSVRWFLSKGEITQRIDGKVVRMTGTCTDVTQRRQTERALKHANTKLARMARVSALGELTASIAHEVNQPLCAIVANANACLRWLDTAAPNADLRAALKDVVQDSHRASEIIRRTRELLSNRPVRKTPLNLNAAISDVLELARGRLHRSGIVLHVEFDEKLPLVSADELQIQQVVLNLVLNAVDAMRSVRERPRVLQVRSRRGRDLAMVSVRDTGDGISQRHVERIFDPFYTTKAGGLGIGLAISRSIVKSHGGALWAVANTYGGTTLRFTIPAIEDGHV